MYKTIYLLFIFFFISKNVSGQNYNELVSQAIELHTNKKYEASIKIWDNAFSIHNGYSTDYYNAACTNSLAGNADKAISYLKKAIKTGWTDINWMKQDNDLSPLHDLKTWKTFIAQIPKIQENYLSSLNIAMKKELENLRVKDQTLRRLLPDLEKHFGRDSYNYKWFNYELIPENDSLVLVRVIDVIEKNGWMGISEVGELANQSLWLVIQHAPLKIQEKYLSLLEESVEKGESKARYMAFLTDRILMRKNQKQIYGTQARWNADKKKNIIYPIKNYETVNDRRKKVGLETIEQYANNNSYLYEPKNYN
ncbi:hypothetical protein D7030_08265 [Flavobacteriaceae bacterium AU392]|nr:hypothetical protein D1817_00150 [Flavobacteriaceae bacterium]RKM85115.1 hypothetical protein D7030_08265 [Flavobacteriaceae bacterium AU392]